MYVKVFNFPSYNREEKDEVGRPAIQSRAWFIAMLAASQAPAGPTAERSAQVNKIYNGVRSLMKTEGTGQEQQRFLNPEGGQFTLEEAEVKVFKEIIDGFRNQVSGAGADALVYLDQLIAGAPEQLKN